MFSLPDVAEMRNKHSMRSLKLYFYFYWRLDHLYRMPTHARHTMYEWVKKLLRERMDYLWGSCCVNQWLLREYGKRVKALVTGIKCERMTQEIVEKKKKNQTNSLYKIKFNAYVMHKLLYFKFSEKSRLWQSKNS